jgi:hypothetical protein
MTMSERAEALVQVGGYAPAMAADGRFYWGPALTFPGDWKLPIQWWENLPLSPGQHLAFFPTREEAMRAAVAACEADMASGRDRAFELLLRDIAAFR